MYLRSEAWCCSSSSLFFCHPSDKRKKWVKGKKMDVFVWGCREWRGWGCRVQEKERRRCVCVCVCVSEVTGGRRRYQITSLPPCPLCCLLVLSVLCTSKFNLSWEGVNSGCGGRVTRREACLLCSIRAAGAPEELSWPLTMTSQMQSGIGPGPSMPVCVYACSSLCVCMHVYGGGESESQDKYSVASVGPSGRTKCTLPVCCMCPLTEDWFIFPVQADPSIGESLTIVSRLGATWSICQEDGWTADESKNIFSGNTEWMLWGTGSLKNTVTARVI